MVVREKSTCEYIEVTPCYLDGKIVAFETDEIDETNVSKRTLLPNEIELVC